MKIFLIESGGFVGVPLQYEVNVSALEKTVFSALKRVVKEINTLTTPPPTSAGEITIRIEHDDGSINEISTSHASPSKEIVELVQHLRTFAKIVPKK